MKPEKYSPLNQARSEKAAPKRAIVRLVMDLAQERGIQVTRLCSDWVLRLQKDEVVKHIHGFVWDLNSSGTSAITKDKCATSAVLEKAEVAHIEHELFIRPDTVEYHTERGDWGTFQARLASHGRLVLKPNDGSGGNGLYLVNHQRELEAAVMALYQLGRNIALSPYYNISKEYRCFVLNGRLALGFAKTKPRIQGDGQRTILELIAARDAANAKPGQLAKRFEQLKREDWEKLQSIPDEGQWVTVGWKHNLGAGAGLELGVPAEVATVAVQAAAAVGLRFGAVDVCACESGEAGGSGVEYRVMEINASAMLENFCRHSAEREAMVKGLYAEAMDLMFTGSIER